MLCLGFAICPWLCLRLCLALAIHNCTGLLQLRLLCYKLLDTTAKAVDPRLLV